MEYFYKNTKISIRTKNNESLFSNMFENNVIIVVFSSIS